MLLKLLKSNKDHDFVDNLAKILLKKSRNHSFLFFKSCWSAALNPLAGRMQPAGHVFEVPDLKDVKEFGHVTNIKIISVKIRR
jgi:hypothetical protein